MYWDLADPKRSEGSSTLSEGQDRKNLEDELPGILKESCSSQLVSDVPVGVFLSGGIDSSGLVALLSGNDTHLNTSSLVFREADYSEAEHSRAIAQEFGTEHREISVSQQEARDAIPDAILGDGSAHQTASIHISFRDKHAPRA